MSGAGPKKFTGAVNIVSPGLLKPVTNKNQHSVLSKIIEQCTIYIYCEITVNVGNAI